jgi:hypothetical protein
MGPGIAEGAGVQMVAGGALQTGETTISIGVSAADNATIVVRR